MNNDHQPTVGGYHATEQLSVEDIDSYIEHRRKDMAALSGIIKRLPKVDDQGHSECPFAESLYAEKEEETTKFIESLSKLPGYIALVNREIQRFKQNLSKLSMGTHELQLPQAREKYQTAKQNYEFHYQKYTQRRDTLVELSKQADEVLREAQSKKWPLGTPREKYSFPSLPRTKLANDSFISKNTNPSFQQLDTGHGMQNEIDSLMAIGPLGK